MSTASGTGAALTSGGADSASSHTASAADARGAVSGLLEYLGTIRFSGPDAQSFLQGQISNDTRRLGAGAPLLAAYSTPQGRVLALLHLLPHSSGILALLPRELVAPTIARLAKFVFRAKVKIEDLSEEYGVAGAYGAHGSGGALGDREVSELGEQARDGALDALGISELGEHGYREQDGVGVGRVGSAAHAGGGAPRRWVVGPRSTLAKYGLAPARFGETGERDELGWRLSDIRAGMPQVYAATTETFVAQMLNLDLIDGISFTKGCYTGQEIIARTQHLGRIKRRLFRLKIPLKIPEGSFAIGQGIALADGRAGRLVELVRTRDALEALAVLRLEPGGADAESGPAEAVAAVELPLPYAVTAPQA